MHGWIALKFIHWTSKLFFLFCFFLKYAVQNLLTRNGIGPPELSDYDGEANNNRFFLHHQAIITTYTFDSCGNITEWGADLHRADVPYSLDFQVWRPSPTVDRSTGTGCYSLVGDNRFTSASLSNGILAVTPSPQDYIMFQPQDVLGFYIRSVSIRPPDEIQNGLVIQTSPRRFTSELVWYTSISPNIRIFSFDDCLYSVGHKGILVSSTQAAPVISVGMSK